MDRYRANGYRHIFRLDSALWPIQGEITLEVTLLERDSDVLGGVTVINVEVEMKYLKGKNFHRGYVDVELGPYEHRVE